MPSILIMVEIKTLGCTTKGAQRPGENDIREG